ncbi:cucumber peeling cupredoxin-like [Quillaja saponaria]|uniref:Cucumber peeling cupredoxin-like n=1 Tax=Quillaja saponaria TaxID=32244 RepID=A0AAD7Q4R8_QUISA|nr:cucumber peeling cupredoxin-like [Quillaja saponaria]
MFNIRLLILLLLLSPFLDHSSAGTRYTVGDSPWNIPPYPTYFDNWSSSNFFRTGDSLVFDFETNLYNLIQVPRQDYEDCTSCNPIKVLTYGPATIPLTHRGVFYFICNISNYCSLGQKISVTVHNYRSPDNPTPAPLPSPSPPPTSPVPISSPSSPPKGSVTPPTGTYYPSPHNGTYSPEPTAAPVERERSMAFALGGSNGIFLVVQTCLVLVFIIWII